MKISIRILVFLLIFLPQVYGKVYDCFLFFNELDVLEIRLNELYDVVDHFVLVEAAETHKKGDLKPFYFEQEKERFKPFLDKIIHVKLEEHIACKAVWSTENPSQGWEREYWQRDQIMRGLQDCHPEDIILISDVDEIIPKSIVPQLSGIIKKHSCVGFRHHMYRWFLNRKMKYPWPGTVALSYKYLAEISPQKARGLNRKKIPMYYMGWHFTSMGGFENMKKKQDSITEGTESLSSYKQWRRQVNSLFLVRIDDTFPDFVQKNIAYLISRGLIEQT